SDYIVFDSAPYYLSSQNLNVDTLETVNYDRDAFAWALGLKVDQLPLLASLLGNDVIHSHDLLLFHRKICKDSKFVGRPRIEDIVPKVIHFMKPFEGSAYSLSQSVLNSISKNVFGDTSRGNLFQQSIYSYALFQAPPPPILVDEAASMSLKHPTEDLLEAVEKEHRNCALIPYMHSVLAPPRTWESSSALEDYASEQPSSALIYRPLRQRIYSIVLAGVAEREAEQGREARLQVIEWCVYKGNKLEKPDVVDVVPMPEGTKPAEVLWLDERPEV
ncbi:unnamed protein product, partial [Notodromas monacha]